MKIESKAATIFFFLWPFLVRADEQQVAPTPPSGNVLNKMLETLGVKPLEALITALFALIIIPTMQQWYHRQRIKAIFRDVEVPQGDRKNSIMLVGLGGSGKSTLAKRLCGDYNLKPTEKTERFEIYKGSVPDNKNKYHTFVSDYKGQNIGTKVKGFVEQQLIPNTPFRFGFINSLILVVDIICDESDYGEDTEPSEYERVSKEKADRLQENKNQWNRTALDAVFGMHKRSGLNYVCLFINKIDRLKNPSESAKRRIEAEYSELAADLDRRCHYHSEKLGEQRYAYFECIVGSAYQGLDAAFLNNVKRFSVPLSDDAEKAFKVGTLNETNQTA